MSAQSDHSVDVVLLLGALYHLLDRAERLLALSEAHRVLRPGGLLFAAGIARWSALTDLLLVHDRLGEAGVVDTVREIAATGRLESTAASLFTDAYMHMPEELREEVSEAGFEDVRSFAIEGPGCLASDVPARWNDPARREALLEAARLTEEEPAVQALAGHLLAIGLAPTRG